MKNILLLGDSIRMMYQPEVKKLLKGRANVFGPSDNCRWSDYALNNLRFILPWLPDPEIVHLNNGIWDIGDNYEEGRPTTPLDVYEDNMRRLIRVVRKETGAKTVICALTTPYKIDDKKQVPVYNKVLRRAAEKEGALIDDLYTPIMEDLENNVGMDKIHLSPKGVEIASKCVVKALEPFI